MKRILTTAAAVLVIAGCGLMDEYEEFRKERKERRAAERRKAAVAEADAALEQARAAEERKYSATNDIPLHVAKPMAWFAETDAHLRLTRQRLMTAQTEIAKLHGEHRDRRRVAAEKDADCAALLKRAEDARAKGRKNGWPVAFDKWVIHDEAELDAKTAEIEKFVRQSRTRGTEDEAAFNLCEKARANIRATIERYDAAYRKFTDAWTRAKLEGLGGVPGDLEKEINDIRAITDELLYEWNRVK